METIWHLTYSVTLATITTYNSFPLSFHMAHSLFHVGMVGLLLLHYASDSYSPRYGYV